MYATLQPWFTLYSYDRALLEALISQHVLRLCNVLTQTCSAAFTASDPTTQELLKYTVNNRLVMFLHVPLSQ
jgi:hypothetical protein